MPTKLNIQSCHPERSRRTSPTWITYAAFERSLDYARDDIAMLGSGYPSVGGNWADRRAHQTTACETPRLTRFYRFDRVTQRETSTVAKIAKGLTSDRG